MFLYLPGTIVGTALFAFFLKSQGDAVCGIFMPCLNRSLNWKCIYCMKATIADGLFVSLERTTPEFPRSRVDL